MRLTEILGRLDGVEEDHDGYLALCPAHPDRKPSLKLTLKDDGKLLMVCRSGCPKTEILAKLRMSESDLFDVDGQGVKTVSAKAPETVGIAETAGLKVAVDQWASALQFEGLGAGFADTARQYAADRFGLSAEQCAELLVGLSTPAEQSRPWLSRSFTRYPRLTVPLVSFDGVVRGLQGRDLSGKCTARWMSLTNVEGRTWSKYGVLSAGTGYDTILITEGPGDGLTSVGVGYDALIIRGAALANNAALLAELVEHLAGRDVVIAFDPDTAGERGTKALAKALNEAGNPPRQLDFPNEKEDLTAWRERTPETFAGELHLAVRAASVVELEAPAPTPAPSAGPSTEPDVSATDTALQTMSQSAREAFDQTDVGIAVRLRDYMARAGGGVRYAKGLGFLVWDGTVWAPGNDEVRTALLQMGAELIASGDDGSRKIALKALTNRAIEDVIKTLPSVPGVPTSAGDFDADPELLSVSNGTVNLRTGELHPHSPDDMITRRLNIAYRPQAQAPRWGQFLVEVFPNHPEMPRYMQRSVGYGITGSTAEQCFFFLHGQGANGKSVFLDALIYVFRGITKSTEFSTFEQRVNVGQASPELASLRGARLVTASETEKYSRLAEALVKQLTGGDPVTCRFLNQNPFTYVPSFLLMVAGNYKPAILSQDLGVWRRVKLIPFEATFRGAKADRTLPAKLRDEAEGILAWAVRGAMEWYASGLEEPVSVESATQDYRESEDRLAEFLTARCVREADARVAPMAIRRAYAEWAEDAGLSRKEVLSGWALGVELESRDFLKSKKGGRWGFEGLRLMTDEETQLARAAETDLDDEPTDTDIFGQQKEAA
ncbi:phage/plasmid primase, P4 family [Streptomyces canus]|uniref:phage/plasmid primase, P4 family n=1 Tax=Streptomyces canus TaxID=58343 RepID=UPI003865BF83|nr:phage/plasmid primase, P4 family [Streptomyces canus]